ncbi:MAG: hypothetical protein GX371_07940 [Bacteroidales bacterium]|nr:hypothetical protein [Bacteroidales bacterium]
MTQGKVEKSINRLLGMEIISTVIVIVVFSFIIYSFEAYHETMKSFWNILIIFSGVLCFATIFWEIYKVLTLMKIDLSKKVNSTIYYVNKYQIQLKREFFMLIYFIFPVLFILAILTYAEANASFSLWMFLVCIFSLLVIIIWYSKKKYKKMHAAILASLTEIKELEEE